MTVDTLFRPQSGGGGGGSTSDYIKDVFMDVSRPATNNTGFTSTSSNNPLDEFFGNPDSPQYGIKTLFIKHLDLIEDQTKWINSKPTYKIVFTEEFPQVKAYAYGNVRILDTETGFSLFLGDIDDACGVVGNIRQVAWIANTTTQTGTITPYLDTVSSSALTFGSAAQDVVSHGINSYNLLLQNSSLASDALHDFRVEADQANTARIVGMVVYFQNDTLDIECLPGSTYVNKTLSTTTLATQLALPTVSGRLGSKTLIYKTTTQSYGLSTIEPNAVESVGVGAINTNLIDVSTGTGASFPIGTLFGSISSGTSFAFGIVTNQSTDTLTVGPTLAFGVSGPLYKYGYAGTTFSISASTYSPAVQINPATITNLVDPSTFGATIGTLYYQDPASRFRIWGSNLMSSSVDGVAGIMFLGASGFLQVDGKFAAADFEHISRGIFHATFSINGLNCFGLNQGYSGIFRKTILSDSGPGWNSFVITPGASFNSALNAISNITLYDLDNKGVTAGLLAQFENTVNTIPRAALNATLMTMGPVTRHYSDELYLTGAWTRAVGASFAGGVAYYGASTNSSLKFQYYGTDFAFIGTAGGSMTTLFDGASISSAFGAMKTVATLGWHTVQTSYNAGATAVIEAIAIKDPQTDNFESLQNYNSDDRFELIPDIYQQAQTPAQAKNGDLWFQVAPSVARAPVVWVKAFNLWMQIPVTNYSADPNSDELYIAMGDNGNSTAVSGAAKFNGGSWSTIASPINNYFYQTRSSCQYQVKLMLVGGQDSGGTTFTTTQSYNKASWFADVALGFARQNSASYQAFGFLYHNKGSITNSSGTPSATGYKFNNVAWATPTAWNTSSSFNTAALVNSLLQCLVGQDGAGTGQNLNELRTFADSVSAGTVCPATFNLGGGSNVNANVSIVSCGQSGDSATSYTWNGSSWSSSITAPTAVSILGAAYSPSKNLFYGIGGEISNAAQSTNWQYNGVAFSSNSALLAARSGASCGSI